MIHFPPETCSAAPDNIDRFVTALEAAYSPIAATTLESSSGWLFRGREHRDITLRIHGGQLDIVQGLHGPHTLLVRADSEAWLDFVNGRRDLFGLLFSRKIVLLGSFDELRAILACFRNQPRFEGEPTCL